MQFNNFLGDNNALHIIRNSLVYLDFVTYLVFGEHLLGNLTFILLYQLPVS